eukprot:5519370-Prymnesium_polylepis.1
MRHTVHGQTLRCEGCMRIEYYATLQPCAHSYDQFLTAERAVVRVWELGGEIVVVEPPQQPLDDPTDANEGPAVCIELEQPDGGSSHIWADYIGTVGAFGDGDHIKVCRPRPGLWPMMRPGAVSGATRALRGRVWHEVRAARPPLYGGCGGGAQKP